MPKTIITNLANGERLPATQFDMYKHMNKYDSIKLELDMNDLAKFILNKNYGVHRFLSALREEAMKDDRIDRSDLVEGLEQMFFDYRI